MNVTLLVEGYPDGTSTNDTAHLIRTSSYVGKLCEVCGNNELEHEIGSVLSN